MCFLVLQHRTREDHPLVLLHNRDEAYARPFDPPRLLDVRRGIFAPRDLRAGGSWIGVNRHGLVAAISNRHGEDVRRGVRSRGLIVLDVLRQPSAEPALDWMREHLRRFAYAGFHLLLADGRRAFVVRHRGSYRPHPLGGDDTFELFPGVYVLTNLHEPGTLAPPDAARPVPGEPLERTIDRLRALASDEELELPGGHRVLKRGKERGTVASTLLAPPFLFFAAGPPDRVPFRSLPLPFPLG